MPCARGLPGADGRYCPYVEHQPLTDAGQEAWDIGMRAPIIYHPWGDVAGFDLVAALAIAGALGYAPKGVVELLPAVESGLLQAAADAAGQADGRADG